MNRLLYLLSLLVCLNAQAQLVFRLGGYTTIATDYGIQFGAGGINSMTSVLTDNVLSNAPQWSIEFTVVNTSTNLSAIISQTAGANCNDHAPVDCEGWYAVINDLTLSSGTTVPGLSFVWNLAGSESYGRLTINLPALYDGTTNTCLIVYNSTNSPYQYAMYVNGVRGDTVGGGDPGMGVGNDAYNLGLIHDDVLGDKYSSAIVGQVRITTNSIVNPNTTSYTITNDLALVSGTVHLWKMQEGAGTFTCDSAVNTTFYAGGTPTPSWVNWYPATRLATTCGVGPCTWCDNSNLQSNITVAGMLGTCATKNGVWTWEGCYYNHLGFAWTNGTGEVSVIPTGVGTYEITLTTSGYAPGTIDYIAYNAPLSCLGNNTISGTVILTNQGIGTCTGTASITFGGP
jgi:hypothetical protein